jgi:hypothetical protein
LEVSGTSSKVKFASYSFLVASNSSLAAACAASLASTAFSSASSASLLAFAAASLASAPLVLGVNVGSTSVPVLAFFLLPTLVVVFFVLFLQKINHELVFYLT